MAGINEGTGAVNRAAERQAKYEKETGCKFGTNEPLVSDDTPVEEVLENSDPGKTESADTVTEAGGGNDGAPVESAENSGGEAGESIVPSVTPPDGAPATDAGSAELSEGGEAGESDTETDVSASSESGEADI